MRLQVFLSHSGACSRRKALLLVKQGEVTVNGRVIQEPSYDVDANQDVQLGAKKIELKKNTYLVLNKPRGVVTTSSDKYASRTVKDLLPPGYRHLYPVGRLDKDSEGLLLFTNDGELAFKLMHPRFKVDKVYFVEVRGRLRREDITRLEKGVFIEGRRTHPAKISPVYSKSHISGFSITIHEGRKRQIRLMLLSLGYKVNCLRRIQYGPIQLAGLKPGRWRMLPDEQVSALRRATIGGSTTLTIGG